MFNGQQATILGKLFERRQLELSTTIRNERLSVATKMAAIGMLQSGAFVVGVTQAFVRCYETFAKGVFADTFDLLERSGVVIDGDSANWMQEHVDRILNTGADSVRREASKRPESAKELKDSVDRAMEQSLARMRRDFGIELALLLVAKPTAEKPAAVDASLLDTLVDLQNERGFKQAFQKFATNETEPLTLVWLDIDHIKEVNDKHGGHAVGDEALVAIANTAVRCVKGKGQAFRLHGDEFAFLLPNHSLHEGHHHLPHNQPM